MTSRIPPQRRGIDLPKTEQRLSADVDAELAFHLEERVAQLVARGVPRADAEQEVRARFGDPEVYRQATRAIDEETERRDRRASWWDAAWRETRHAVRTLARHRSFTAMTLVTLALGLAAATTMFAVIDGIILRPLPYTRSEELVSVLHPATVPGSGERRWGISPGGYFHIQRHGRSFAAFGVYGLGTLTLSAAGEAEQVRTVHITHTVQDVLATRVRHGRLLRPEDDLPGAAPVAVLSAEFHERRFGGDPAVVGTTVTTSNGPVEVIGVLAPGFTLPMPGPFASSGNLEGLQVDAWLPLRFDPAGPFWNNHPYVGVGRLKPGMTAEAAGRDLAALLSRFPEWMPNAYSPKFIEQYNFRIDARPLRDAVLGDRLPRVLWMLFAAVAIVLGIAAANVANLFLVRQETRWHEAAVRTALGADRRRMAIHFLAESMVLCLTAAFMGVVVGALAVRGLLRLAPANIPRLASVTLEWPSVTFAFGVAIAIGLVVGLVPLTRQGSVLARLREGGRGSGTSRRAHLVRQLLVGGQVALTLLLLTSGGALLGAALRLREVVPGFESRGVLAFDVALPFSGYDTREKALNFYRAMDERLRALPGVAAAGAGALPIEEFGTGCAIVFREGRPYADGEQTPCVPVSEPLPGYFETLGIQVVGRSPTWADVTGRTGAAVVTQALADRLWPGEDPLRKGIASNGSDSDVWYRIVGVVPALRAEALDRPLTEAAFYAPTGLREGERTDAMNYVTFVVRTASGDPLSLVPSVRAAIRAVDPQVPMISPRRMDDVVSRSLAGVSLAVVLMASAGLMGLLLSAVGLYGVVSWLVAARRNEIGVRVALGARRSDVVRLIMGGALRILAGGVVVGGFGAWVSGRLLAELVTGTTTGVGVAGALLLLVVVVLGASWLPTRRAVRIDPVEAMRRA